MEFRSAHRYAVNGCPASVPVVSQVRAGPFTGDSCWDRGIASVFFPPRLHPFPRTDGFQQVAG